MIIWVTGILLKYYLVQYSASIELNSLQFFSQADSTYVQTHTKTYISFLTSWGHAHLKTPLGVSQHSSEIRGLCLMKCSSETLQNLPYFLNSKTP